MVPVNRNRLCVGLLSWQLAAHTFSSSSRDMGSLVSDTPWSCLLEFIYWDPVSPLRFPRTEILWCAVGFWRPFAITATCPNSLPVMGWMVALQKTLPMPYAQNLCISPYVQEKQFFFPFLVIPYCVFLPCVSPSLLTQNTWLLTLLVTECVCVCVCGGGGSSHHAIICDTIWVSSNSTRF